MIKRSKCLSALLASAVLALPAAASAGSHGFGARVPQLRTDALMPAPNYGQAFLRGARYLGPAHIGALEIQVVPKMQNVDGLRAYALAASDPHSRYYRHWLTPGQIADAFGATAQTQAEIIRYFQTFGVKAAGWKQRELIRVWGAQKQMEAALGTRFGVFERFGKQFYAPIGDPHLAAALPLTALVNVVTFPAMHRPMMMTLPPQPISGGFGNGRVNGYSPYDLGVGFDSFGAWNAGYTGKGINVGVIGTGPIAPAEIAFFRQAFNVPGSGTFTIIPGVANTTAGNSPGDSTPPPPTDTYLNPCTGSLPACNPEDLEAQLDAEQETGLAPDASVLFYLAYNGNELTCAPPVGTPIGPPPPSCVMGTGAPAIGLPLYEDEIQAAINDNQADVLDESFGSCEAIEVPMGNPNAQGQGVDDTEYATLVSEGIAVFVSSGDSGPEGCQRLVSGAIADEPSASTGGDDPNVVSVGGTTTPLGSDGRLTGPITVWGVQTKSNGAEGSSQSVVYATPPYQAQPGISSVCSMRCQPDVVLNGDPFTGAAVVELPTPSKGAEIPIGGTSASAPDMSALWAVVLSACKVTPRCQGPPTNPPSGSPPSPTYRLGNPNFLLYNIYKNQKLYHQTFYDITYGQSAVPSLAAQQAQAQHGTDPYSLPLDPGATNAGPGFDNATGLGAPFGRALVKAIVGV